MKLLLDNYRPPIINKESSKFKSNKLGLSSSQTRINKSKDESRKSKPNRTTLNFYTSPQRRIDTIVGVNPKPIQRHTMQRCVTSHESLIRKGNVDSGKMEVKEEEMKANLDAVLESVRNAEKESKEVIYQQELAKNNRDKVLFNINWEGEMKQLHEQKGKNKTDIQNFNYNENKNLIKGITDVGMPNTYFELVTQKDHVSREVNKERRQKKRLPTEEIERNIVEKYDDKLQKKLTTSFNTLEITKTPKEIRRKEIRQQLLKALKILRHLGLTPGEVS